MARSEIVDSELRRTDQALASVYAAPEPDPVFVRSLRERLLSDAEDDVRQAAAMIDFAAAPRSVRSGRARLFGRRVWASAAIAAALVLALIVALAGPERVMAELGRLRGYLFGVGFVDLEHTRALPAPVSVTRDGVTLTVSQVLAQPSRTVVTLRADGLPPLADETRAPDELSFHLRLPDGSRLSPTGWSARRGEATVNFPPLPTDVYRVDLLVERLPLTLPGAAPENWEVSLGLHPAGGEMLVAGYTAPYVLADAANTHSGVTLRLVEVAHGGEGTGLNLEVTWPDLDWAFPRLGRERRPSLRDEQGHVYYEDVGPSVAYVTTSKQVAVAVESHAASLGDTATPVPEAGREHLTLSFGPVSPAASRLTLTVDAVTFRVPLEAEFTLDLGADPHLGQEWPLDVVVDVAGLPLRVTTARLEANESEGENEPPYALRLRTEPLGGADDRSLGFVSFSAPAADHRGTRGDRDPRTGVAEYSLLLGSLPREAITIQVGGPGYGADVAVRGPWVITWDIPGGPAVPMEPLSLSPDARQENAGLALRVERVAVTDRLTAVTLSMDPGPEGETLVRALAGMPGSDQATPYYLTDERGNRYEAGVTLGWEPADSPSFDPHRLLFQPLAPLAGRVTFHAPAIMVLRPAPSAFEVTVPDGVQEGEPWPVGVDVSVGGYRLHFTEARLQTGLLVLTADLGDEGRGGERVLAGLSFAAVTGPDGAERPLSMDAALVEQFGQVVTPQGTGRTLLMVGFSGGAGGEPMGPGTYRVEVAGVNEAVPGPWKLSWGMP